jgi:hypothetical protein
MNWHGCLTIIAGSEPLTRLRTFWRRSCSRPLKSLRTGFSRGLSILSIVPAGMLHVVSLLLLFAIVPLTALMVLLTMGVVSLVRMTTRQKD